MVVPASDVYVWTRPYTDSRVATRNEQEVRTATNLHSEPRNVSPNGAFGYVALTPAKTVVENVYNRRFPSFCTPGKNIETGAAELYITALARQTVNANNANDETHSLTPHAARMVAGSPTAANHRATLRVASTVSATSRVILRNAFDVNDARLGPTATAPPERKRSLGERPRNAMPRGHTEPSSELVLRIPHEHPDFPQATRSYP